MNGNSIVVLAAGMGSRYGGLKQLVSVGPANETLLDYSVYDAIQSGFEHIVFIIRRDIEQAFRETIGNRYADKINISYAFQELDDLPAGFRQNDRSKPWGTAHALYAARQVVKGCFAVINADDFYGRDAYATLAGFLDEAATGNGFPMAMVGYPLSNTLSEHGSVNRGLCQSVDGLLQKVEEITGIALDPDGSVRGQDSSGIRRTLDPRSLVSMNFWGFSESIFPLLEAHLVTFLEHHGSSATAEFYIPSFVDALISGENLPCRMLETSATWFGVTYPEDRNAVQHAIRFLIDQKVYPSPLLD